MGWCAGRAAVKITPGEVAREAVIVLAGALLAAFVVNSVPPLKRYIKDALM